MNKEILKTAIPLINILKKYNIDMNTFRNILAIYNNTSKEARQYMDIIEACNLKIIESGEKTKPEIIKRLENEHE